MNSHQDKLRQSIRMILAATSLAAIASPAYSQAAATPATAAAATSDTTSDAASDTLAALHLIRFNVHASLRLLR